MTTRRGFMQRVTGFIGAAYAVGFGRKAKAGPQAWDLELPEPVYSGKPPGGLGKASGDVQFSRGRVGRFTVQVRANNDGTFSRRDTRDYGATWSEWKDFPEFFLSKRPAK